LVQGSAMAAIGREEISNVPIVFVLVGEPTLRGIVASLAHPGKNITGFTHYELPMAGKWLELLKEMAPGARRIAVVFNPGTVPSSNPYLHSIEASASPLGAEVISSPIRNDAEIESVIASFAGEANGALLMLPDAFTVDYRDQIVSLAARYHLPAV